MNLPKRKPTRLKNFDYNQNGYYFITICTHNKQKILCDIVGGDVLDAPFKIHLKVYGLIVDETLKQMSTYYDNIMIDKYVIMPNHIHIILIVNDKGTSWSASPTRQHSFIPQFISSFKRFSNKKCGQNIFQRSFHDHIIRGENDYLKIWNYIDTNPAKWVEDCFFIE